MEKLSEVDFRKILRAIEILTANLDDETLPQRAVEAITAIVETDFVSYNEVEAKTGYGRFFLRPDISALPPASPAYAAFVRRFGNHPLIAQQVARTATSQEGLAGFVSRLRLLGMVGNCCGEAELRLNLGMTLSSVQTRLVGIALHRSVRDFDDHDAACLEALRPHLVSAYKNSPRNASRMTVSPLAIDGRLTAREGQVLYWVSMGKTNDEVGTIIGAKPLTVKKHLEHIYDKLGVPNRTAAARVVAARNAADRAAAV